MGFNSVFEGLKFIKSMDVLAHPLELEFAITNKMQNAIQKTQNILQ
jgi:hypothetical protein